MWQRDSPFATFLRSISRPYFMYSKYTKLSSETIGRRFLVHALSLPLYSLKYMS